MFGVGNFINDNCELFVLLWIGLVFVGIFNLVKICLGILIIWGNGNIFFVILKYWFDILILIG